MGPKSRAPDKELLLAEVPCSSWGGVKTPAKTLQKLGGSGFPYDDHLIHLVCDSILSIRLAQSGTRPFHTPLHSAFIDPSHFWVARSASFLVVDDLPLRRRRSDPELDQSEASVLAKGNSALLVKR